MGVATPAPLNDKSAMIRSTCAISGSPAPSRFEPGPRGRRASHLIAIGEFPIGDVVQQGRQFDNIQIGPFFVGQIPRGLPNTPHVPPVVSRTVSLHQSRRCAAVCGIKSAAGGRDDTRQF